MINEIELKNEIEAFGREHGWTAKEIAEQIKRGREIFKELDIPDVSIETIEYDQVDELMEKLKQCATPEKLARFYKLLLSFVKAQQKKSGNITQKILKTEWIPKILENFKEKMPPIDKAYPTIHYATQRTLERVVYEICNKIHARVEFDMDSSFEFIHGETGDAILIYMENLEYTKDDYEEFAQQIYSYLGRFYAVAAEPEEWFWDYEFEKSPDTAECMGYFMWRVFIGVAISSFICYGKDDVIDPKKFSSWLRYRLKIAFSDECVDIADVASYFAIICTIKCSADDGNADDCISAAPASAQTFLRSMRLLFEEQMAEERFWVINEKFLRTLGLLFIKMQRALLLGYEMNNQLPDRAAAQKRIKAKRKAQKQARKNNRRRK